MHKHTLVHHGDIQRWVIERQGQPAMRRQHDGTGNAHARLAINFPQRHHITRTPGVDDGLSPVSWTAWLAELDRQQLALLVTDRRQPSFEFIERGTLN